MNKTNELSPSVNISIAAVMSVLGKRGGASRSAKKLKAIRKNVLKAQAARRKAAA